MPYEFTPEERIQNILHILESLQERLVEGDSSLNELWIDAIKKQLINLDQAVADMKAKA